MRIERIAPSFAIGKNSLPSQLVNPASAVGGGGGLTEDEGLTFADFLKSLAGKGGMLEQGPNSHNNASLQQQGEFNQLINSANPEGPRGLLEKGLNFIPGIGPGLSAASGILGGITDSMNLKDEFGIYKGTGAEVADRLFDPIGTIGELFSGELFGGQQRRKDARDLSRFRNISREISANSTGTVGRNGLKTKFSL